MKREKEFTHPPYGAVFLRQVESCHSSMGMTLKTDFLRKEVGYLRCYEKTQVCDFTISYFRSSE